MKENYKSAIYSVEIELPKSSREVFNALTNLSGWWPEEYVGESPQMNTEFILRTGDTHYSKNKIIEYVPDKKFAWLTTESIRTTDNYDWSGTKMIFELTHQNNNTLLTFTYDGVVLENESERLIQICDMTMKDMFYNYLMNGK